MADLSTSLGPVAEALTDRPRVYADANVPAGIVAQMRDTLQWDVLFVLEHPDLRRARDEEHFRLARQLRRTLVTLDRDYLDDRAFPATLTAGVLVITAPDERGLAKILTRVDTELFATAESRLPLDGRKLHAHSDWKL
ncbi:MAG: DUF5615 family PIN-like protein [Vicinamibacterales bacterium]